MSDTMLDAYSETNKVTGVPYLHTCTLVVGDGTAKVNFVNGRAQVPTRIAKLVNKHPHVIIPALGGNAPQNAADRAELDVARQRIAALEAELAAKAAVVPEPEPDATPEVDGGDYELTDAEKLALEHLAEEEAILAENTTPPADAARDGFESATPDGQARCQAAKGDGSQCANPAIDGHACAIGKHKDQLAVAA